MPYKVLVERLKMAYWPSWLADYYKKCDPMKTEPIDFISEDLRGSNPRYDARRVRYFIERLRAGQEIEPISIESHSSQYRCGSPVRWGPPFVDDGHHRYVAAVLTKTKYIPATFGGVVSTIRWLTGKRKTIPPEML